MKLIDQRPTKPRQTGKTNVLDKGLGLEQLKMQLEACGEFIDVIKLGWGTSLVTPNLEAKLDLIKSQRQKENLNDNKNKDRNYSIKSYDSDLELEEYEDELVNRYADEGVPLPEKKTIH